MKKILVLNYEFPPLGGGASPVSYEIAKRLSETGDFDIDVVTMGYKDLPRYEEVNSHFRIHRVRCWRSKKEICHPWEQATYLVTGFFRCMSLVSELRKRGENYDICHTHFVIPTGVISFLLKKLLNIPYIITSHGSDIPGFNTDRFAFAHRFTRPLLSVIIKNARKIISPSFYLKKLILDRVDKTFESQVKVIPNGIDTQKITPQEKKKYIFSSGRLLRRKGFQYLITAVSSQDIGYEVHIAGDGPMMESLNALAKESKTKIVLHGWLSNTDRAYKDLLEQSAIYVLASEKENASIALLEAMSAGCAVITTNVSGCPETVGDIGMLVPPQSSDALSHQIRVLMNDESLLKKMQFSSRQRAETTFEWNILLEQYKPFLC